MANFYKRPKPVVLIIMDGVGVAPPGPGNPITLANTENLDKYWPLYPHTYLEASGLNVGLPEGTDGNSEVGHMAIGAGRVIFQSLPRIDNSIQNGSFFQNVNLLNAFEHAKTNKSAVHIMGLIGTGYVHASNNHLEALIKMASEVAYDRDKVFLHLFTDGRDSSPEASIEIIEKFETICVQKKVGHIASIGGRAFAMDRNRNWKRTKMAYDVLTGNTSNTTSNIYKYIKDSYNKDIKDEYLDPVLIKIASKETAPVKDNDAVIYFNFRPDRAVQLTMAFEDPNFTYFERTALKNLYFVGMTDYENGFPKLKAFPPEKITKTLGKSISDAGLKQLRIAESEKYPHVTYFFNGANKEIMPGETWLEVPSPKDVATYDLTPGMSQEWVTNILIEKLKTDEFDFVLVNFAAPDMVAHTGSVDATIKAVEICDQCIGKIAEIVLEKNGMLFITADHGNAEELVDLRTGKSDTKHSTNPVPFLAIKDGSVARELTVGGLTDIAPTILNTLGLSIPPEMTGRDLLSS